MAGGNGGSSVISREPSGRTSVKISAPQVAAAASAASANDPSATMRLYALIGVFETRNPFLPSRFLRRLHHATGNEDSTIAGGRRFCIGLGLANATPRRSKTKPIHRFESEPGEHRSGSAASTRRCPLSYVNFGLFFHPS